MFRGSKADGAERRCTNKPESYQAGYPATTRERGLVIRSTKWVAQV